MGRFFNRLVEAEAHRDWAPGEAQQLIRMTTTGGHTAEGVERVRLYAGVTPDGQGRNLRDERTITRTGRFQAVEPSAAGVIKMINDPTLEETVRSSLSVKEAYISTQQNGGRYLSLAIVTENPPTNIAFDVVLVSDKEHHLGRLTQRRGNSTRHQYQVEAQQVGNPRKSTSSFAPASRPRGRQWRSTRCGRDPSRSRRSKWKSDRSGRGWVSSTGRVRRTFCLLIEWGRR